MCATTPARELGLAGFGVIAEGAMADLVVLSIAISRFYERLSGGNQCG